MRYKCNTRQDFIDCQKYLFSIGYEWALNSTNLYVDRNIENCYIDNGFIVISTNNKTLTRNTIYKSKNYI